MANEDILENYDDQLAAGAALREQRLSEKEAGAEMEEPANLREVTMNAKREAGLKEKAKEKIAGVNTVLKVATSAGLKWAWNVFIPSFGLSLIYINMHVFLRFVFPDFFCKLGEEWRLKKSPTDYAEHTAKNIQGTVFGIVEVMGLLLLDILAIYIIGTVLYFIVMIVNFMGESWWGKLVATWKAFMTLGWGPVYEGLKILFLKK